MQIAGFVKTTLLDYPGRLACTVFTQGCNLRCPFCQNGSLVLPEYFETPLDTEEILAHIKKRSSVLEGVCITGGEPTLMPDLKDFIKKIKELDLLVKLDTNGTNPEAVSELINEKLIDHVAMDIKASPEDYAKVCGLPQIAFDKISASVELLRSSGIAHEFRTTLVKGLHSKASVKALAEWLAGPDAYFLQSYREEDGVIEKLKGKELKLESFSKEELNELLSIVREYLPAAELRGVD